MASHAQKKFPFSNVYQMAFLLFTAGRERHRKSANQMNSTPANHPEPVVHDPHARVKPAARALAWQGSKGLLISTH